MPSNANQKHAWKPNHLAAAHALFKSGDITKDMIYGDDWETRPSLDLLGQREEFPDVYDTYKDKHGEKDGRKQFQRQLQEHYKKVKGKEEKAKAEKVKVKAEEEEDDLESFLDARERSVGEELIRANEDHEKNQQYLEIEMECQQKLGKTHKEYSKELTKYTGFMEKEQKLDQGLLKQNEEIGRRLEGRKLNIGEMLKEKKAMHDETVASVNSVANAKKKAFKSGKKLEQAKSDYNSDFEPVDSKENSGGLFNSIFRKKKATNPADEALKSISESKKKEVRIALPKDSSDDEIESKDSSDDEIESKEIESKDSSDTKLKEDNKQHLRDVEIHLQLNKMDPAPTNTPKPRKKAPSTPKKAPPTPSCRSTWARTPISKYR